MTSANLARSYLEKAKVRLEMIEFLSQRDAYSDVVREAQELVELATKATLRQVGIEPPKWHDVGGLLLEHASELTEEVGSRLVDIARISRDLRKERELSFYGDEDFIPTAEHDRADADRALADARFVVETAEKTLAGS